MKRENIDSEILKLNRILKKAINTKIVKRKGCDFYDVVIRVGMCCSFTKNMFLASNGDVPILEIRKSLRDMLTIILKANIQLEKYLNKRIKS